MGPSSLRAEDDNDGVSRGRELLNHPNNNSLVFFSWRMRQNYHRRKASAVLGTPRMRQDSTLKQSHGQPAEARTFLLHALSRDSMAEQSARGEILYRVSSMLEKKVLLLQRQLQHKVWSEYERLLHPLKESHTLTFAQLGQWRQKFAHCSSRICYSLVDSKSHLICGTFWQHAHNPMHKFFCFL